VITTNPLRSSAARARALRNNLSALSELLTSSHDDSVRLVRSHADYLAARRAGKHAAFIGIQGGNAVDADFTALDSQGPQTVLRVTLLHLTRSTLGAPSAPRWLQSEAGLTPRGRELVQALDERRVFVDLAHINRRGFFDALESHDRTLPALVTHTGVSAIHAHWRNLDDAQLRAIAETGGCVGIMYHAPYLGGGWLGGSAELVFRHIEHAVRVAGEDHVSLGSDWDGAIVPPSDLGSCADLPRLVQVMLEHGWTPERIRKVLGLNFLRALHELRG
jgi:membrane dipeptidase